MQCYPIYFPNNNLPRKLVTFKVRGEGWDWQHFYNQCEFFRGVLIFMLKYALKLLQTLIINIMDAGNERKT